MDFERLFTLVIIMIIWGVSSAVRKMAKAEQKTPASAGQQPGLLKIILQNLAALEEKGPGEEVMNLDDYLQPTRQGQDVGPEEAVLREISEDSLLPRDPTQSGRKAPPPSLPAEVSRLPISSAKPGRTGMNRRQLQNAVVWAEILAPPVALRDP